MKKLLTISLLFICVNSLSAQNDVQQLPLIHPKNPEIVFEKLVASDNSGFYALFNNKKLKSYCIEKFDLQGKSLFSTNFKGEPEFEQIGEKSLYIFSSEFDKADGKKGKLYLTEINAENGAKVNDKVISQQELIKKHDYEHFFSLSPDKTKLLVISRFFCLSEELPEKTTFRFFEVKGMKQIWEKEIDNKFGAFFIKTNYFKTNNDGDVFLDFDYASTIINVKAVMYGQGDGRSTRGIINSKEKSLNEVKFEFPENISVNSYLTQMGNDGNLLLYGMFRDLISEKDKKNGVKRKGGVICMLIDLKTSKSVSTVINRYDPVVDKKLSYDDRGSGDAVFWANELLEMDGYYYFISSYAYSLGVTYVTNSNYTTSNNTGNIMVTKVKSSTGVAEWTKILPKYTTANIHSKKDETAINYHVFVSNNQLHFVYLDHPSNFEKYQIDDDVVPDNLGTIQGIDKANVILVTVNQNGKGTKRIIFDNQENCVLPQKQNIVINKKSLVLCLENFAKKERRFGLLTP